MRGTTDQIDITIDAKYNGPPDSGNGGYVSGLLAEALGLSQFEVFLKAPPPIDTPMMLTAHNQHYELKHGDRLIATISQFDVDLQVPFFPTNEQAIKSANYYPGFERHVFPRCFVCGPDRDTCDGLRLYTGRQPNSNYVAAPFETFNELFDHQGKMYTRFISAALDCPGAYAITQIDHECALVLGNFQVSIEEEIAKSDQLIVVGWYLGTEGRKNYSGTAIIDDRGHIKAKARAVWIEIDPNKFLIANSKG